MKTVRYEAVARMADRNPLLSLINKTFIDSQRSFSQGVMMGNTAYVYIFASEDLSKVEILIQNSQTYRTKFTINHHLVHWHDIAHIPLMHNAILNSIQETDNGS